MTRLILIRHGATDWTFAKRYQGLTDIPLNAFGKKQIKRLADKLRGCKIDFFYHSLLKRAAESAAILAKKRKAKASADPRINEFHFGAWEGKTAQELLRAKDPFYRKWCRGQWVTPPGGESLLHFKKRICSFLSDILKRHEGKTVAVVSHGGPVRMIMLQSLRLPMRFFWSFYIEPGSLSVLHFNAGRARWAAGHEFI